MQDVHSLMKMKIVLARVTVYLTLGKCSEGFICINPLVCLSKLMLLVKNNGAKCKKKTTLFQDELTGKC